MCIFKPKSSQQNVIVILSAKKCTTMQCANPSLISENILQIFSSARVQDELPQPAGDGVPLLTRYTPPVIITILATLSLQTSSSPYGVTLTTLGLTLLVG